MRKRSITTLWELVSKLQANLERAGLEREFVDAAVVLGVESMLTEGGTQPRREPRVGLMSVAAYAKA